MDLDDDSVDGVLCRWGYMLMSDRATALAETRRVLRDGGRLSLSVWGAAERNPWASLPAKALTEHTGAPPANPKDPGIYAMADPERVRSLVQDAGFAEPRLDEVGVRWRFEDCDAYWRYVTELAGGGDRDGPAGNARDRPRASAGGDADRPGGECRGGVLGRGRRGGERVGPPDRHGLPLRGGRCRGSQLTWDSRVPGGQPVAA